MTQWVVKVGPDYLQTLCWLLLTEKQSEAQKFNNSAVAWRFAKACRGYPEYASEGVKVFRLKPATGQSGVEEGEKR